MRNLQSASAMLLAPLLVFYGYRVIGSGKRLPNKVVPPAVERKLISDAPVREKAEPAKPDMSRVARALEEQALRAQERLSVVYAQDLEPGALEAAGAKPAYAPGFNSPRPIAPDFVDVATNQVPAYSGGATAVSLADCPGCKPVPVKNYLGINLHRKAGPRGDVMFVTFTNESKRAYSNMTVVYPGAGGSKRWEDVTVAPGQTVVLKDGYKLEAGERIDVGKLDVIMGGSPLRSVAGMTELECEPGTGLGSVVPKL